MHALQLLVPRRESVASAGLDWEADEVKDTGSYMRARATLAAWTPA